MSIENADSARDLAVSGHAASGNSPDGAPRGVRVRLAPPTPSLIDGFETRRRPGRPQTTSLICRDPKV